jgi:hypothetical protein
VEPTPSCTTVVIAILLVTGPGRPLTPGITRVFFGTTRQTDGRVPTGQPVAHRAHAAVLSNTPGRWSLSSIYHPNAFA